MLDHLMVLAQTGGQGGSGQQQGPPAWGMLPMLLFMLAAFYFLLWRPQAKQRKEMQKMLAAISNNDRVVTSAGIHGTVTKVNEKTFVIRIADGVKVEFDKGSVTRIIEKADGSSATTEPKSK